MKISRVGLVMMGIGMAGLFAFSGMNSGSVKGTVSPASAGINAWIISATDTLKVPVENGSFEIANVKPGTYKIVIEAKPPFRNAAKDDIAVGNGQVIDVGEIKLIK